jgi:hypothetical protein
MAKPSDSSPSERPASDRTAAGEQKNDVQTVPLTATPPHVDSVFVPRSVQQTMHRAFTERGRDRGVSDYVIDSGTGSSPIIGRLVGIGLHDELTWEAYAVIDGTDGRAHPRALPRDRRLRACATRRRRRRGPPVRQPSDIDLDRQATAPGATWLDYRLAERER